MSDIDYCLQRAEQENQRSATAASDVAALIHRELRDRYLDRVRASGTSPLIARTFT